MSLKSEEYTFCMEFGNGSYFEIQNEFRFTSNTYDPITFNYNDVIVPSGTLIRVDNLDGYYLSLSILLKYNKDIKKKNKGFSVGKYSQSFQKLRGMKYKIVNNIDDYIKSEERKRKIESVLI